MSKKVLISGGAGFAGHHMVEHIMKNTDWEVCVVDKLNYASFGYDRLRDISVFDDCRIHIVNHDFVEPLSDGILRELEGATYFIHMGAETHVDNSIIDPVPFIRSNVMGTHHALMGALRLGVEKFVYFSTDEVFGPAPVGVAYKEDDRYHSGNPYAATKAGGEELAVAYANTYNIPVIVTHTMNIFGERQHPEKFIPKVVRSLLDDKPVVIHSDPTRTKSASRFWIHARNASDAVMFLLENGNIGEKYNIVGEIEMDVLTIAKKIAKIMGKSLAYEMVDFHSSRPGHDMRYALDGGKLRDMGYEFPKDFFNSLEKTVLWMVNNQRWLGK